MPEVETRPATPSDLRRGLSHQNEAAIGALAEQVES